MDPLDYIDRLQRMVNESIMNDAQENYQRGIQKQMLDALTNGSVSPSASTSNHDKPLRELVENLEKYLPKTYYLLLTPTLFDRLVRETHAMIVREYQTGLTSWLRILDGNTKCLIWQGFDTGDDKLLSTTREFFNSFLEEGVYDPETDTFTHIPIVE